MYATLVILNAVQPLSQLIDGERMMWYPSYDAAVVRAA